MSTKVGEMSINELKAVIGAVFDEKIAALTDPDYGLELREEVVERLQRQKQEIDNGTARLIPFEEVLASLGIDESELATDEHDIHPALH